METKICKHCSKAFPKNSYGKDWESRIYCSRTCRGASDRTGSEKSCKNCGVIMYVMPYQLTGSKEKKYCSQSCRNIARPVSIETKAKMSASKKGKRPHYLHKTGEDHHNWKGGIGTERHRQMATAQYKKWRTAVFEKDNYTCQMCEQYSGALHADHIEKWSENEELRYAVDNGRTLCVACHYYITFKKKMKPGQRWCNFTARKAG